MPSSFKKGIWSEPPREERLDRAQWMHSFLLTMDDKLDTMDSLSISAAAVGNQCLSSNNAETQVSLFVVINALIAFQQHSKLPISYPAWPGSLRETVKALCSLQSLYLLISLALMLSPAIIYAALHQKTEQLVVGLPLNILAAVFPYLIRQIIFFCGEIVQYDISIYQEKLLNGTVDHLCSALSCDITGLLEEAKKLKEEAKKLIEEAKKLRGEAEELRQKTNALSPCTASHSTGESPEREQRETAGQDTTEKEETTGQDTIEKEETTGQDTIEKEEDILSSYKTLLDEKWKRLDHTFTTLATMGKYNEALLKGSTSPNVKRYKILEEELGNMRNEMKESQVERSAKYASFLDLVLKAHEYAQDIDKQRLVYATNLLWEGTIPDKTLKNATLALSAQVNFFESIQPIRPSQPLPEEKHDEEDPLPSRDSDPFTLR